MKSWARRRIAWMRTRDLQLVAALAGIGVLLLVFLGIADQVRDNSWQHLDEAILLALRDTPNDPLGPDGLEAAVMHLSALGSGVVTGLIVTIATIYCVLSGHRRYALLMVASSVGTGIVMTLLKGFFERPRPTVVTHIDPPGGLSFPSGHSMISAALYMTLAVLIARTVQRRSLRVYVVSIGVFMMLLVGFTRLYLGVHYPTDVLAGWTLGLVWALICGLVVRQMGKRGVKDVPPPQSEEMESIDGTG